MSARAPWQAFQPLHVPLGEFRVSRDPGTVISTLLGSCVAACLFDPEAGVGGLNHFLLPDGEATLLFGSHSMEMLVNAVIGGGGRRRNIVAKAFGGARLNAGSSILDVGRRNVQFVRRFLQDESFPLLAQDLGGNQPRRVWMQASTGRVWVEKLPAKDVQPVESSERHYRATLGQQLKPGAIDLFS